MKKIMNSSEVDSTDFKHKNDTPKSRLDRLFDGIESVSTVSWVNSVFYLASLIVKGLWYLLFKRKVSPDSRMNEISQDKR